MSERVAFALANAAWARASCPAAPRKSRARNPARYRESPEERRVARRSLPRLHSSSVSILAAIDLVIQLGSPRSIAVAHCNVWDAPATGSARNPKAGSSQRRATNCVECGGSRQRRCAAVRWTRCCIPDPHRSTCSRSNSLPPVRETIGMSTSSTVWCARRIRISRSRDRKDFDDVVSMLADGIATSRGRFGTYLTSRSRQRPDCVRGAARGWRRSRRAARFPKPPTTRSLPNPRDVTIGTAR